MARSQNSLADGIHRIQNAFKTMKQNNALEQYAAAREACEQYGTPQWRSHVQHAPTFGGTPVSGSPAAYGARQFRLAACADLD